MAFPDGWTKKRQLTIPAAQVGTGGVVGYTLPLKVTATSAKADGSDLRVSTASDGSGLLTVDVIEVVGSGVFWIRVGTTNLSAVVANDLWLWSGNAAAAAQTGSGAYDANWAGYWPTAGGTDQTGNGNNGTAGGGVTVGGATGKVGDATTFDGVDDVVTLPELEYSGTSKILIGAWINPSSISGFRTIFAKRNGATATFQFRIGITSGDAQLYWTWTDGGSFQNYGTTTVTIGTSGWQHIACAFDWASPGSVDLYLDGSKTSVSRSSGTGTAPDDANAGLTIGRRFDDSMEFAGDLNEVQLQHATRSDAWIATEYNATNDPAAFLTQGTEEDVGGAPAFPFHQIYRRMAA